MKMDNSYSTMTGLTPFTRALADLTDRGYKQKFRKESGHLSCIELYRWINPDQFNVDESYYFEKIATPDTDRMIYAITANDGVKGILVDTCGVYADNMSLEMVQKLGIRKERHISADENEFTHNYNNQKDNNVIPVKIR